MDKIQLRKKMISKRKSLSDEFVQNASSKIFDKLVCSNFLDNLNSVFVYSDFKNEVKTNEIIKYLIDDKRAVYLPKCNTKDLTMTPVRVFENSDYTVNKYGIIEPNSQTDYNSKYTIDCVIVPGIVFDTKGNRIGFGAGYYDKFFSKHKNTLKIALAYDFQVIDSIENDEHDVAMDIIITEKRTITINRG